MQLECSFITSFEPRLKVFHGVAYLKEIQPNKMATAHFYAKQRVIEAKHCLSLAYTKVEKPHYLEIEMDVTSKAISADCSCVTG